MSIKNTIAAIIFFALLMMTTQSIAQQHTSTKQGSDDNARAEQVFDDVATMDQVLVYYKIEESKLQPTIENYQFWVAFLKENRISSKRKGIIREFLGTMKRELAK